MAHGPTQTVDNLLTELRLTNEGDLAWQRLNFDPAAPEQWTDDDVDDLVAAARLCRRSGVMITLDQQWTNQNLAAGCGTTGKFAVYHPTCHISF